jgi:hypothetical protein
VSFVHLAIQTEDGQTPLAKLDAFQRFQENVRDRCDEPPAVTDLHTIGSYRL